MGYTRKIQDTTRRRLYANSGNICAMYNCDEELIYANSANLSEICHIEAVNEDGARYNANSSNEEVNSYDNLLLLCPTCHKIVDSKQNEHLYTVDYMKRMKNVHENRVREAILEKPAFDMPVFIRNIDVSKVIDDYNNCYEKAINENKVYETIEKTLALQPALRSILYGIVENCYENKTVTEINMQLVWRMSNINEYEMANILETLTDMHFVEEYRYVDMLQSMIEDEDGDVHIVNNNYLYKLHKGVWGLRKKTIILLLIRNIFDSSHDYYSFIVNKDISILEKSLRSE